MPLSGSLDRLTVLFSTSAADAVMNTDGAAAFPAAPLIALVGKEDLQPLFPDIPYILKRRLTEGILGCVAVLLFHHVCAGEIRALVAEPVSVFPAFPTQDDAAASGAELRFVLVRTVAGQGLSLRSAREQMLQSSPHGAIISAVNIVRPSFNPQCVR